MARNIAPAGRAGSGVAALLWRRRNGAAEPEPVAALGSGSG